MFPALSFDQITTDDISYWFNNEIKVSVLRLDKLHPVISGNKWFKLRYYIEEAKAGAKQRIVTFGGAWSNHIVSTAAVCAINGLPCTGIIRGEEPADYSSTLQQAKELGMQLVFISREEYRDKIIPAEISAAPHYIIAEGGFGPAGVKGASTILEQTSTSHTHYCCAVGTGTMLSGIIQATTPAQKITGISVLKNNMDLETSVRSNATHDNWQLAHDYHFGGYAKQQSSLIEFMNDFYRQTGIPSDFVYTGKLFYAVNDLFQKQFFPRNSNILLIHSGGLQGNDSLRKGTLIF